MDSESKKLIELIGFKLSSSNLFTLTTEYTFYKFIKWNTYISFYDSKLPLKDYGVFHDNYYTFTLEEFKKYLKEHFKYRIRKIIIEKLISQ